MPYRLPGGGINSEQCTICFSAANILKREFGVPTVLDCSRCGDFSISHEIARDFLPIKDEAKCALASYLIRRMQSSVRPLLTSEFFRTLSQRKMPMPAEIIDNVLLCLSAQADQRPGRQISLTYSSPPVLSEVGAVDQADVLWAISTLKNQRLIDGSVGNVTYIGHVTAEGWERVEELKRAHISSQFAFFARQFSNPDLDRLFNECLKDAVQETGYELRVATQRAGLIDAVIEDEIRRCRFVVADLSNKNDGAYWEAGLAEGLGKDVIYICRDVDEHGVQITTHFDANHRQTVKWNLNALDEFATRLKAVIRNTLLGDAKQPG